jgi:hypothetical protein
VSATVLTLAFFAPCVPDAGSEEEEGVSAGKRPAALPPGLSVGLALGTYGKLPTDSGEALVTGVLTPAGAAVTVIVADAIGSLGKCAALAMAISRTDVTADAVAATATRA